jgi:hypothetical protein
MEIWDRLLTIFRLATSLVKVNYLEYRPAYHKLACFTHLRCPIYWRDQDHSPISWKSSSAWSTTKNACHLRARIFSVWHCWNSPQGFADDVGWNKERQAFWNAKICDLIEEACFVGINYINTTRPVHRKVLFNLMSHNL